MKISTKKSAKIFVTTSQQYSPEMKEYIFAIKGRPFAMLASQKLPVPPVSLIDFNLVRDLGLEIQDLQCSKYTFAGMKLRILGRISQTLQTIQDGKISGTAHVRANVVENLYGTFDCHSIAGKKMMVMLSDPSSSATSTAEQSPASPKTPTKPPKHSRSPALPKTPTKPPEHSWSPATSEVSSSTSTGASDTTGSPEASPSNISKSKSSPGKRSQPDRERQVPPDIKITYWPPPYNYIPHNAGEAVRQLAMESNPSFYGRVMKVSPQLEVDYHVRGQNYTEVYTSDIPQSYKQLKVGNAVRCTRYCGYEEARRDGHTRPLAINRLYTDAEANLLQSKGAVFPEVSPDLRPGGYYG